jgi:hypothetical protein
MRYGTKYRTWGDYNRTQAAKRNTQTFRYGIHLPSGKKVRSTSAHDATHLYVQFLNTDELGRTRYGSSTAIDPATIKFDA